MRAFIFVSLACAATLSAQAAPPRPAPARPTMVAIPAVPLGRWTPIAQLPGMGRSVDTAAVAARRRALLRRIGRGVALIPAASRRQIEIDHQQDNDFRQDDTFFYFTGLESHDAWLLLTAARESAHVVLLLPARDTTEERWTGIQLGPDSVAVRLTGIRDVVPLDSFEARLALALRDTAPIYLPLVNIPPYERSTVERAVAGRERHDVYSLADSLRTVKDADELRRLRTAIDITVLGHRAGMRAVRPGMYEYQLEAVIEATFRGSGADRVGYPSFVGSGPNGATLHYDTNRRQMRAGELVAVDAGAEWGQYTADVTRTFPVSGRFTPRQKALYDLVLGTQRAAFDSVRPGVRWRDLNRIARNYMETHSGKLCGERTCDEYFVHGLGHWLGMNVHDPGEEDAPFAPGMVLTIEPGIYLPEESLGIRIEDDVLVTATGAEWLSAQLPRTTDAIERLMAP